MTKSSINNRGYNKFLKLEGEIRIFIDGEKYVVNAAWDGLKGYVTNTGLSAAKVIENYGNLWYIERAIRMNRTDLHIRPVYHHLRNRIEGHIWHLFHSIHGIVRIGKNVEESKVGYHSETGAGTDQKYVPTDISLTEIRDIQNKNPEYGR